jgi:hypothetical protein
MSLPLGKFKEVYTRKTTDTYQLSVKHTKNGKWELHDIYPTRKEANDAAILLKKTYVNAKFKVLKKRVK